MDAWQFILAVISTGFLTSLLTWALSFWKTQSELRQVARITESNIQQAARTTESNIQQAINLNDSKLREAATSTQLLVEQTRSKLLQDLQEERTIAYEERAAALKTANE